ncbi:hypothetical protein [Pseudomonas folii]|uniref:Lipoprotein n=1 Tax=Pseudomonas folii TaxID=2762593 RepID=A0ABR7B4S9_9PSED|nr:hypothetical protein [Pseudomonas folii]MBC3952154.1 hypothetical protein [Pseudomonas folii]
MHIDCTAKKSGLAVKVLIGLTPVWMLQACQPVPLKISQSFDVPYGQYHTLVRHNVLSKGELFCQVHVEKNNLGDAWVPSVVLAAAEDDKEDYSMFLTSSPTKPVGDTRLFSVRTHLNDKPIVRSTFFKALDTNGDFSLRLAWHEDGSITYQVATANSKSEEQMLETPGFQTRHVSVHTSGVTGSTNCELKGATSESN